MLTLRARIDTSQAEATIEALRRPDLAPALEAGQDALIDVARVYPPPPAGSRYKRTYALRDGWAAMQPAGAGRGLSGGAQNDVEYAPYVVGSSNEQAAVHAGRWRTEDQISEAAEPRVVDAVERRLDATLPR